MMLKTAESVTPNHPDKICDRISDAILDECLRQDPDSRVAVETMGGHGIITITGEITTKAYVDVRKIAQRITDNKYGVQVNIVSQSPCIASGVDTGGAGDQGIMVGYACAGNKSLIPNEVYWSRELAKFLYSKYKFDGKTQVTMYNGVFASIVASFQNVSSEDLREGIKEFMAANDIQDLVTENFKLYANPAGDWDIGGFEADTGVTGRKLAVDNYGPQVPIGGGAFSGKDPSKVDRSGAYMARKIAVDLLKKLKAKEVIVKLAYAIGVAEPVMANAVVDGIEHVLNTGDYDLTPKGIIEFLKLKQPQYEETACWGHFGNSYSWDI